MGYPELVGSVARRAIGLSREQLAMRKRGIFASEISAVMTCCEPEAAPFHPYLSALEVWRSKADPDYEGLAPSLAMMLGVAAEPVLLDWLARQRGYTIEPCGTLLHRDYSEIGATPDGLVVERLDTGCEAKLALNTGGAWSPTEIPDHYAFQVQTCMTVTGRSKWDVIGAVFGQPKIYQIQHSEQLSARIIERARHFWHDHVLREHPPKASGHASCGAMLRNMYPRSDSANAIPFSPDARELADKRISLAKTIKELTIRKDSIEHQLMELCGSADGIDGVCTWRSEERGRISHKDAAESLMRKHGYTDDFLEQFRSDTPVRTLRIKEMKQ